MGKRSSAKQSPPSRATVLALPTRAEQDILSTFGFRDPTRMPTVEELEAKIEDCRVRLPTAKHPLRVHSAMAWCRAALRRLEAGASSPFEARMPGEEP